MDIREFIEDTKKGAGQFADWRDDGKIVFFLHPKTKFKKRTLVRLPVVKEDDQGELQAWTIRRFHQGDDDWATRFLKFLREATHIKMKTVVLEIKAGSKVEQWRKGDLLKVQGYDWKKNIFSPRTEYLFDIIRAKKPKESEILVLPWTAGKKVAKLIDDEIEELGEEDGNPCVNPWALQVTFDEKASGSDMYSVRRSNLKVTDAVTEIFGTEPNDVSYFCDPISDDEADGSTLILLAKSCVIACPLLDVDLESEDPDKETEEAADEPTTKPAAGPKPGPKTVTKPSPLTTPAVKPKAAPKPPAKPKLPTQPKVKDPEPEPEDGDGIPVSECQVGVSYLYDEEELVFGEMSGKKGVFYDPDNCKVKVGLDELVQAIGDEQPEETEAEPEPEEVEPITALTVRDLGPENKGQFFYDSEGNHLKFIRYNDAREKGVFQNKEGERVFLDGDEIVSGDSTDETDAALEPMEAEDAEREAPESEEPESTEGDGDEEKFQCPNCKGEVSETDPACPHCDITFTAEGEDEDKTPFDGDE